MVGRRVDGVDEERLEKSEREQIELRGRLLAKRGKGGKGVRGLSGLRA